MEWPACTCHQNASGPVSSRRGLHATTEEPTVTIHVDDHPWDNYLQMTITVHFYGCCYAWTEHGGGVEYFNYQSSAEREFIASKLIFEPTE